MKGLVLNDLYSMKRTLKMYPLFMAFFLVLGITTDNLEFFSSFVAIYSMMFGISIFSYHEICGWDSYVNTLPVTRAQVVGALYVTAFVFVVCGSLVSFCMNLIMCLTGKMAFVESMIVLGALAAVGILMIAVVIPLLVKFGSERGRLILMGSYVVVFLGFASIGSVLEERLYQISVSTQSVVMAVGAAWIIVLLLLILSYRITLSVYRKKEF
ncbi:MAG: ABC-2 transporter permease [Lachnospiraceae bacterium]|nr:ABC-2 transporter permease [Lachnospiraceae bacterium]